jgi:hypothetical protein
VEHNYLKAMRLLVGGFAVLSFAACKGSVKKVGFTEFWPDSMHHQVPTCGPVDSIRLISIPPDAATWNTWAIPEYQDEQRFVTGQSQPYGPIACVAARQDLDKINSANFSAGPVLVAVVWVDPGVLTPAYRQLNLSNGFNCVFIEKSSTGTVPVTAPIAALGNAPGRADNRWRGYVVPSHDRICDPPGPTSQLSALGLDADGESGSSYPPVARFMILNDWKPAIGVRCGAAWCVIGTPTVSMLPAPAHVAPVAGSTGPRRTMFVVPGWYDEQQVAVPGGTGTPPLTPSLKASIVPDPDLDTYTVTANFDTGFVRVATVFFEEEPTAKYLNDYQFHIRSTQEDTLYLRHITTGRPHWVARVNNNSRYFRVMRTPHAGSHVTGTARWAWDDNDEVIWVRCDDGCCLVDSDWSSMMSSVDLLFKRSNKGRWPG